MNFPRNIAIVLLLAAAGAASAQTTTSSDQTRAAQAVVASNTSAQSGTHRTTVRSARKQPARVAQNNHNHDSMTGGGPN